MVPHAILQKSEESANLYLLVRYPNRFHIITVNRRLTVEAEERILSSPCSDSALDEMGIKRLTLHRANVLGVGIGGGLAGDILVLHTRDKKLRYILSDDCKEEEMTALFDGIKRLQSPKNSKSSKLKKDWRAGGQNPELREKLSVAGFLVNAAGFILAAGALLDGRKHPIWYTLSLLVTLTAFYLYLRYPLYFSMLGKQEYQRHRYSAQVTQLFYVICASLFVFLYRMIAVCPFRTLLLFLAGVGCSILMSILLYRKSQEIRQHLDVLLALIIAGSVYFFCVAVHLNAFLNFDELPPRAYEVTELDSYRGSKSCFVQCNGEEVELDLPLALHDTVQVGDSVMVVHDKGALGFDYAYVVGAAD